MHIIMTQYILNPTEGRNIVRDNSKREKGIEKNNIFYRKI